jgi:Putative TM nitroreductase
VAQPQELREDSVSLISNLRQTLKYAIRFAILAPSGHNTQPWLFRVKDYGIEVLADRTRALPVVDPQDRALVISCGAAIYHLRLALSHYGLAYEVKLLPDIHEPDLLAEFVITGKREPSDDEATLFAAIPKRRTNRMPFESQPVPSHIQSDLLADVTSEGCWLHLVSTEASRLAISELVAEGDRVQAADPNFRHELAAWIHPNRSSTLDGMPGYSHGVGDLLSNLGPFMVRTFDWGNGQAAKDRQLAVGSPLLVVIGSATDTPLDWLLTGQGLGHMLLRATAANVAASFLNQPIEVESLRPRLSKLIGFGGFPQLLLRLGYGHEVRPTPRRLIQDVIIN